MFTIFAVLLFLASVALLIWGFFQFIGERDVKGGSILLILGLICGFGGFWFQTHTIVPTQHIGVSKDTFSQKLRGHYPSGIMAKPFFSSVYRFPSSSGFERCEQYTPAIKGSYGITLDLCFYYDTGNVDWVTEINRTGSLDANFIMNVWRNSVVGNVAKSVKDYTPEELNDERFAVEQSLYANILPWFSERGVPLSSVSFKNWDFTSAEVGASFDASIVSQRKITEQSALFEAAKISRERELYEAETSRLVAEMQKETLNLLGFEGNDAVQYLWQKSMSEGNKVPDVLILGNSDVPVTVPVP